jgi:hypothetical protein
MLCRGFSEPIEYRRCSLQNPVELTARCCTANLTDFSGNANDICERLDDTSIPVFAADILERATNHDDGLVVEREKAAIKFVAFAAPICRFDQRSAAEPQ